MTKISRLALAAMLALGAGGALSTAPVFAQKAKKVEGPAPPKLSKQVQAPLSEAQKLIAAGDNAGALVKVQAADAVKTTPDEAFVVNQFKLNVAIAMKDDALTEQAIEGQIASGRVDRETQTKYITALASLALRRNDTPKALAQYERLAALSPNDAEIPISIGELYRRNNQNAQAVASYKKGIEIRKASGQPVPEAWYRNYVRTAYDAKLTTETGPATAAWVSAYPTPTNWRDALVIFRDARLDDQVNLDAMRLMRAAGALTGERDFVEYAETAAQRGLPGEAKAILDEGVAKNMLSSSKPYVKDITALVTPKVAADRASLAGLERDAKGPKGTAKGAAAVADGYLSYGNWAKAAELYQLALSRPGVDAATANTRLGIALARQGGKKAEAEAAFKAVQGNPTRQQLAQLWLAWVAQQA